MPRPSSRLVHAQSGSTSDKNKPPSACLTCRRKKVKCSGTVPCEYCVKRNLDCNKLDPGERRLFSVRKIQDLENRLAQFERAQHAAPGSPGSSRALPSIEPHEQQAQDSSQSPNNTATFPPLPAADYGVPTPGTSIRPCGTVIVAASPSHPFADITHGDESATDTSPASAIPVDAALSSSNTFGSRVFELLGPPSDGQSSGWRRYNHVASPNPQDHHFSQPFPSLPSEAEARRLVETVHFYIGQTQSHYDPRVFFDRMDAFYTKQDDIVRTKPPWLLQMLIVFALGKLFLGDFEAGLGTDDLPGSRLFDFALRNLPTLSEQYSHGSLAVETLALVALYLQNVDRQGEAYVYTSTALRLAVAHGFHRKTSVQHLPPSERIHLNRLWWTVYMQERRLAAATGKPCGISDEAMDLDLPSDSPGFGPAAPLRLNMKIAQITGRILSVLYGTRDRSEDDFVSKVQEITQSLYNVSKEIPAELSIDVRAPGPELPIRTSASLQLMLLQATLLTVRPIMLHVAQLILNGSLPSGETLIESSLGKLSRICSEAARRLLNVVVALKERKMLAIFGFFDCDATFSAAFVMVLTAIFDSACHNEQQIDPSPGLDEALETLQYLASKKNCFAIQRLEEVRKVWDLIKPYLHERQVLVHSSLPPDSRENPAVGQPLERSDSGGSIAPGQQSSIEQGGARHQEGGTEFYAASPHWYPDGINQAEGVVGVTGMNSGGVQQTLLPNALWDDISDLWHPLGEFNEGVFTVWNPDGQDVDDGQRLFQDFLNNPI